MRADRPLPGEEFAGIWSGCKGGPSQTFLWQLYCTAESKELKKGVSSHRPRGEWGYIRLFIGLCIIGSGPSLLIGNDLDVIGGLRQSECNGVPVANIDLIDIDLIAAIHTVRSCAAIYRRAPVTAFAIS